MPTGGSLCVSGATCDSLDVYHNVGLAVKLPLAAKESSNQLHAFALGLHGAVIASSFSPTFGLDLELGAHAVYARASKGSFLPIRWLFELRPSVLISATDRDNKRDRIAVPLTISLERLFGLQTGVIAPIDGFGDGYQIPLSVFLNLPVTSWLNARAAFTLPALTAGDAIMATGWDARVLTLALTVEKSVGGR
jgi:hypothetical protein